MFDINDTEILDEDDLLLDQTSEEINQFSDLGIVVSVSDGIVGISGLDNVANGEVIDFLAGSNKIVGMILNLEPGKVSAVVLGDDSEIKPGQYATRKYTLMNVPVGKELLGRVVDPLGNPIDMGDPIITKDYSFIEKIAPSIISRSPVNTPLETGLKVVIVWFLSVMANVS